MRKFQNPLVLTLAMILILTLMVGCSSKSTDESRDIATPSKNMDIAEKNSSEDEYGLSASDDKKNITEDSPLEPEKVITTIYMNFETTSFEKANENLNTLIQKYKAYIEHSHIDYNQYYNNKSYRNGYYTIRVPKNKVLAFKSELNGIGNIISKSTQKDDVTKQYRDTESRLKIVEVKEERILTLLSKAEKIEDIIKLEQELSEIMYEKENLKTSLINIDDKVDYSTLEINIQEVEKLTNQETVKTSFGTRMANAFRDSFYSFKKALEGLIISIIYILPFAVIIGIIACFVIKLIKKRKS